MRSADTSSASVEIVPEAGAQAADLKAARRVLDYAGQAIAGLGASLNGDFSRAVDVMMAVKGRVIVSGMGKSGLIGRKIAATLASTGTPAQFIHPGEASHGDLGAITRNDALLMLSYRGETPELSNIITYAKRFSIPLIGIASNAQSTLLQACDVALVLPPAPEACPMGMAPTTSTTEMIVLGDALAVALMERRGFTADQYRNFHPGGSLGKALIRVSDLMHTGDEMPVVNEGAAMQDLLLTMASRRFGCVGVLDKSGMLCGIVTDGDLSRHMSRDLLDKEIAAIMTRGPQIAGPGQLAAEAVALMNAKKITVLFVVDPADANKRPIGIIHLHDCLKAGLQ